MDPNRIQTAFERFARTGRCRDIQAQAGWPIGILLAAGSWIALRAEWEGLGLLANACPYHWLSHALAYPAFAAMIVFHALAAINFAFYAQSAVARMAYFPCQWTDRLRDARARSARAAATAADKKS